MIGAAADYNIGWLYLLIVCISKRGRWIYPSVVINIIIIIECIFLQPQMDATAWVWVWDWDGNGLCSLFWTIHLNIFGDRVCACVLSLCFKCNYILNRLAKCKFLSRGEKRDPSHSLVSWLPYNNFYCCFYSICVSIKGPVANRCCVATNNEILEM